MADDIEGEEDEPPKKSKLPLLLGLVLGLIGGGGGFYAVMSGMILAPKTETEAAETVPELPEGAPETVFVPIDPVVVAMPGSQNRSHLRFRVELEVPGIYQAEVQRLSPRVVNVLNTYLRALNIEDFEHPTALFKIRAQLLSRINTVTGEGRVNDLLVMEYVIN